MSKHTSEPFVLKEILLCGNKKKIDFTTQLTTKHFIRRLFPINGISVAMFFDTGILRYRHFRLAGFFEFFCVQLESTLENNSIRYITASNNAMNLMIYP